MGQWWEAKTTSVRSPNRSVQRLAKQRHQTTAAWVREALRTAREASQPDVGRKLLAIRDASAFAFPTGSIDELLTEIEQDHGATDAT